MFWGSVTAMSIADVLIIGAVCYCACHVYNKRNRIDDVGVRRGIKIALSGLSLISLFFFADLVTMHVFPWFMPSSDAMAVMSELHENLGWPVMIVGIGTLVVGIRMVNRSTVSLVNELRKSRHDLRTELGCRTAEREALRASEERYRRLVDVSPDGILVHTDRKIVFANAAFATMLGAESVDALMGICVDDLIPEDELGYVHDRRRQTTENAQLRLRETRFLRLDGTEISVERVPVRITWQGRPSFLVLVRDITERKGAERELRQSRRQAEAANRAKSEFLANVSHELRTPLNAIIGFSEVIVNQTFGPDQGARYRDYAVDIHSSGKHLLDLINDILDLSKIESGATDFYEENVVVTDVMESAVKIVTPRAQQGGVELFFDVPDKLPLLRADARKLMQILINLLSNGIKFTHSGGRVTVTAWARPDSGYVFQVTDTGIGMALEDIPIALTPFGQVDGDLDRKYEGTGLGLPLAKALTELHSGSLDVQSRLGEGTSITVRLPAERIVAPTPMAATDAA